MHEGPASLEFAPGTISANPWNTSGEGEGIGTLTGQAFFNENMSSIQNKGWDYLPFDMHWLAALQAGEDRYTFIVTGLNMEGTNGAPGYQWTVDLARPVYEMLGVEKNLAVQVHKMRHGIDREDLVKMFAYLDHMEGKHGEECDGTCDMTKYLVNQETPIVDYFTKWTFTIDSLMNTPFIAGEENATTFLWGKPCCEGDCEECDCAERYGKKDNVQYECPFTGEGECCERNAPPRNPAQEIVIDFETDQTSGNPRSGVGWDAPANGGTITDGVLSATSTNWNSGSVLTITLAPNTLLGDYETITLDYQSAGPGGLPVSIYAFSSTQTVPSGGWLGDSQVDKLIGQIPCTNSEARSTLTLDISGMANSLQWIGGTFKLVIGRNAGESTSYSMDNIKLIPREAISD
jgi:hypothetical protein